MSRTRISVRLCSAGCAMWLAIGAVLIACWIMEEVHYEFNATHGIVEKAGAPWWKFWAQ